MGRWEGWRERILGDMPGIGVHLGVMQKPSAIETPWNLRVTLANSSGNGTRNLNWPSSTARLPKNSSAILNKAGVLVRVSVAATKYHNQKAS